MMPPHMVRGYAYVQNEYAYAISIFFSKTQLLCVRNRPMQVSCLLIRVWNPRFYCPPFGVHSSLRTLLDVIEWTIYSFSQIILRSPEVFLIFFPNGWEFLIKILQACYSFILTLKCKILFNYPQLWQSYAVLGTTTQWIFTFQNTSNFFTNWW